MHKNVIIASGFSGTGFKFGLGIGEIVANLVDDHPPKHDISAFSAKRTIDLSRSKL